MQLLHASEGKITKMKTRQHGLQQVQNTSLLREKKKEQLRTLVLTFR
jgi:hypothetical protein